MTSLPAALPRLSSPPVAEPSARWASGTRRGMRGAFGRWAVLTGPAAMPLLLGIAALALSAPVAAESFGSSAASSVSSAGSAASGSVSDSLKGSSGSSGGQAKVAHGPYRVLAVVAAADRPGFMEVQMRPEAGADTTAVAAAALSEGAQDLWLRLPRAAMGTVPLGAGERVWAQVHSYGVAFARGGQKAEAPFYLVLNEGRQMDLASRVLSL